MNRDACIGSQPELVTALIAQRAAGRPHGGAVTQNRLALTNDDFVLLENLQ